MAVNLKLTHAAKDRVVQSFQLNGSELLIGFVDGSTLTVTIVECNSLPFHEGARIRQISEDQRTLLFECEDESVLERNDSRSGELCACSGQGPWSRLSRISCVSAVIDWPIFLDSAGFNVPLGSQSENTGEWNLVPEFTPPVSPGDRSY
jgi:hypothetical protein